jgi:clathrin heavy chain
MLAENIKFGSCSLESDKFITVCENQGGVAQIAIVDLSAENSVTRQKIPAEAAMMNPVSKIIALRGPKNYKDMNYFSYK